MKPAIKTLGMLLFLVAPSAHPANSTQAAYAALSITSLRQIGEQKITEGAHQEAIAVYRALNTRRPNDPGCMIRLADLYSWTGNYDRAISMYRDVTDLDSENLAALKGMARVMRWSSRYEESEVMYERALRKEPGDLDALIGLALTLAYQRKMEQALRLMDKANRISPRNTRNLAIRGDILAWSGRFDEAEAQYTGACAVDPLRPELYRSLGDLYRWNARFIAAVAAYSRAAELDPKNVDGLINLAEAALGAGDEHTAEMAVKRVFGLVPDEPRAQALLQKLQSMHGVAYARIALDVVKPASTVLTILAITAYFYRRRDVIIRRHPRYYRIAFQIFPGLLVVYMLVVVAVRQSLSEHVQVLQEAAQFLTFVFLVGSFVSLVWVSRSQETGKRKSILAIGAHPDDIELGCGGTLARFRDAGHHVHGLVITSGEEGTSSSNERTDRRKEAEHGAGVLGLHSLWICRFADTMLESQLPAIKDVIEEKIRETGADVVITQSPHDIHQDHKTVFEATKIAARGDKTILCYEDVSTEPHFAANMFVDVTDYIEDKIAAVRSHRTQNHKNYMQPDTIRGRAAHRGLQSGLKYAEAFLLYKGVDPWTS